MSFFLISTKKSIVYYHRSALLYEQIVTNQFPFKRLLFRSRWPTFQPTASSKRNHIDQLEVHLSAQENVHVDTVKPLSRKDKVSQLLPILGSKM